MSSVDLEALKAEITTLGDKIRTLKTASEVDKNAIGATVAALNEAKEKYADNNNGIGVDGKPYEAPMSKADKKAKDKADKQPGPAKPVSSKVLICLQHFRLLLVSADETKNNIIYLCTGKGSRVCRVAEKGCKEGGCQGEEAGN